MDSTKGYEVLLHLLEEDLLLVDKVRNPLSRRIHKVGLNKQETVFMEYSAVERGAYRSRNADRVIPVENTVLNEFKLETGSNVETVQIHYGPYADELARSLHTLALVLGTDIFFRNGSYRPETEEGRKILAHELTHVAQNKECKPDDNRTREELEREAEEAEKTAEDSEERCQEIVFKGKKYKVSERRYKQVMDEVKNRVEYVAEHNTQGLDEEEYLKFLIAYRDMERNGEMIWQK